MKRVLLCVLDWGLGHATRSIPVIRALQRQDAEVFIASSGLAGILLQQEFPRLSYHELPAYRPVYPMHGSMVFSMARQLPRLLHTIRMEHKTVDALVRGLRIDVIISDNRYGCYAEYVPSVFISHQIQVRLSKGWAWLEPMVNSRLQRFIRKFRHVWVPDQEASGLTDHFLSRHIPFTYIGWLSRFERQPDQAKKYDVMAIVSGPEPQRSVFEYLLRKQFKAYPGNALLVTGNPGDDRRSQEGHLDSFSHLPGSMMEEEVCKSDIIIARCGYSTIMDMITLGKKAALVATPGQPEQQWLASVLSRERIAFCPDQETFVLEEAIDGAKASRGLGVFKKVEGLLEKQIKILLS